ncbi:tetratricopeptide repeat protein [Pelagibius marinus]|uniref:tetratricopeptide repeat protein n=1 Tax=Pelagibius marinus TaxID=2762760 RepID=UPI0018728820|nr:tetratricopeptide repeat protein [Pelagibius marinus]
MSNLRVFLRRATWSQQAKWSRTALIALAAGFVPAACGAESPVLSAGLDSQVVQAAQPASPPAISSPYGAYLAGLVARSDGDLEAATDYMLQALRYDPDNPAVLLPALQLAAATGRQEDAASLATRVLELEPQHSLATLILAVEAARAGDMEQADALLAGLPQRNFDQVLVPMLRAWVQTGKGDPDTGLETLSVLKGDRGASVLYGLHAALINEVAGREELAAQEYETLLTSAGRPTVRLTWLAGSFFERHGQRDRALALYRDFVGSSVGSDILQPMLDRAEQGGESPVEVAGATDGMAEVLFNLAGLLSQEQADDAALVYLHQALALRPDFIMAQVLQGEILQKQDRSRAAIAAYRKVPQDSPFGWIVSLRIADELQQLGDNEAALVELDRLADQRPDAYEPMMRKGNLLRIEERFDEAVVAYDEAVARIELSGEIEPQHWSLLYFRGIALERADQWERAEADFKHALGLQPEQPYVMNYLAYSWVEKKQNLDEAEAMLERAVKLRPRDGYIVDSLGWVYYRLGRYEEAVTQLERAVELRPQDPTINDHLGDAFWQVGRKHEARFQWHRALSLDPEEDQVPVIENKIKEGMTTPPEDI